MSRMRTVLVWISLSLVVFFGMAAIMIVRHGDGYEQQRSMDDAVTDRRLLIAVLEQDGKVVEMELEEYIVRVVLGEVSADYHPEALKAQAVAARTYTLYFALGNKHADGAVCTDHRCCQAYCKPSDYLHNGGRMNDLTAIRQAVECTKGEVLLYNDQLICATYFACSGGKTEDAQSVWGEEYPYLKAVVSRGDDCGCDAMQVKMTKQELERSLDTELTGTAEEWIGFRMDTPGDGVALVRIGSKLYTGTELRQIFQLKSTMVDITAAENAIIFETQGYGHRVGMSQHGANAMAEAGNNYSSILLHYYTDVTLAEYIP